MSTKQRRIADEERPTAVCSRIGEGNCYGKLEVSHPMGRRIQEYWLWVWMCYGHHQGKHKNEEIGRYYCYKKATDTDLNKYPRSAPFWRQDRAWLMKKYGKEEVTH